MIIRLLSARFSIWRLKVPLLFFTAREQTINENQSKQVNLLLRFFENKSKDLNPHEASTEQPNQQTMSWSSWRSLWPLITGVWNQWSHQRTPDEELRVTGKKEKNEITKAGQSQNQINVETRMPGDCSNDFRFYRCTVTVKTFTSRNLRLIFMTLESRIK